MKRTLFGLSLLGMAVLAVVSGHTAHGDIRYRSFSASAAIGPPAEAYAAKLQSVTLTVLGAGNDVRFVRLPGLPAIPTVFAGDIVNAVAAGEAGGGFDAAYISGSDLNKAWGFVFNSGVPFGPTFDEFTGFLYDTGLNIVQTLLEKRNVVAIPIVGSPEQLSGYFFEPIGDVHGHQGIGLEGLCQEPWTLRYLPPAENVLGIACDNLVAQHKIPAKNLKFIAAVPGGGSLVQGVMNGSIQGFEFATPVDDVSQLFNTPDNPGTVGVRFVHAPGWHQQFLITWMLVNKSSWDHLTLAQQVLVRTVARDHVLSSYADSLRRQGPALDIILNANKQDKDPSNDLVLSRWPMHDQRLLRDATIKFLNARGNDTIFSMGDRADYGLIIEALRLYVRSNDVYWSHRQVDTDSRFDDWSTNGHCWTDTCDHHSGR